MDNRLRRAGDRIEEFAGSSVVNTLQQTNPASAIPGKYDKVRHRPAPHPTLPGSTPFPPTIRRTSSKARSRYVTTANMMFIITIPPTSRKTDTTPKAVPVMAPMRFAKRWKKCRNRRCRRCRHRTESVAEGPQQHTHFVFGFFEASGIGGFREQRHIGMKIEATRFEIGVNGNRRIRCLSLWPRR